MRILVAGATGAVGFAVTRRSKEQGYYVGTLSRSPENVHKLSGVADAVLLSDATQSIPDVTGYEIVVSAMGAPVTMSAKEKRGFHEVDYVGNRNLLEAARRAGVRRFVYISAHAEPGYSQTAYMQAHEHVVEDLRHSGLSVTIIRPTGIFPALDDFVHLARKGIVTVIGAGHARTNPVHPEDVAEVVVANLTSGPPDVEIGGPEVFTRQGIAELAFAVLGKKPRLVHVPPGVFRVSGRLAGMFNRRIGDLLDFVAAVTTTDCVAPPSGLLRLEDHFRAVAANLLRADAATSRT